MSYLIFGSILIPVIGIIVLSWKFKKETTIWEKLIIIPLPLIISFIAKYASVAALTMDTEYWNSYVVSAEYYESWSTWDEETCTREVCTGTGDDEKCHTETYDCSHCDETGPSWTVYDNIGRSYRVSPQYFENLCQYWGSKQFVELNRHIDHHWFCGKDGDMYRTSYPGNFDKTVPLCFPNTYTNKVQCSKSVFNYQEVDTSIKNEYGLYDYPPCRDAFSYTPILGSNDRIAVDLLRKYNAHLGSLKQVHMMILIYQDKPVDAGVWQETYWKNGNKNEFILCIGVSNNKIKWTRVISWTEVEDLKIRVARRVREMEELNLPVIIPMMADEVRGHFIRKQFADFNYLEVEPTMTAVMVTYILSFLITIGLMIYVVKNDINA